jgi:hypothetical protein
MFTTRRQLPASELAADARLPLGVLDLVAEVALHEVRARPRRPT